MSDELRSVGISRTGEHTYRAVNRRGGALDFGEGQNADFTPVELLLVAMAGCSAIDVEYITAKRAEPAVLEATASAPKLRDDKGNHLGEVTLDFHVSFPSGADGDRARAILERAVTQSRDRLCTVSRTVQLPTPVSYHVDGAPV
jgi:uncharacterized OsmC-like protein